MKTKQMKIKLLIAFQLLITGGLLAQTDTTWHPGPGGGTMYSNNHVEINNGLTVQGKMIADSIQATRIIGDTLKISRIMPPDGDSIIRFGRNTALFNTSTNNISWTTSVNPKGFSIGNGTIFNPISATGLNAIAVGFGSRALSTYSMAFGNTATSSGINSTAVGVSANASADSAMAIGNNTAASGKYSVALGNNVTAGGIQSLALGSSNTSTAGNGAIAMGNNAYSGSTNSIAIGNSSAAVGNSSIVIGTYVSTNASNAFCVGIGASSGSQLSNTTSNSLMVGFNSNIPTLFVGPSSGTGTVGNVGIGTSSPAAKLEINGSSGSTIKIVDGNQAAGKVLTSDANGQGSWQTIAAASNWTTTGNSGTSAGTNFVGTTDNVDFVVKTNNTEKMRVSSGGNVGIGATAPINSLQVSKNIDVDGAVGVMSSGTIQSAVVSNASGFRSSPATAATGFTLANLFHFRAVQGTIGAGSAITNQYGFEAHSTLTGATNNYGFRGDIPAGTNRWNVYMSGTAKNYFAGEVGIGNNAPAVLLDLKGDNVAYGGQLRIASSDVAQITFYNSGALTLNATNRLGDIYYNVSNSTLNIENQSGNKYIILNQSGGNVGIGTTTPGYKLQVGNAGDGTEARANAWNNLSDSSSKTNVVTIHNALKKVLHLRGVTFNWIVCGKPSIGFIAQEVETVLPSIVSTDTITGLKSLDYGKIVPVIVECIKQLDSTNTALAEKDSIKDAKIQELETKDSILTLKSQNQDSIIASLQNQMNQLASLISDCCNNNGNGNGNGHGNLSTSESGDYKSMPITNSTSVELKDRNAIVLDQNAPNPFKEQTTIEYYLPDNVQRAQIIFLEQSGKLIKTVDLTEKGKGVLNIFANDLSSGLYTYSLIVDGQTIETKKMIKQ